MRILYLCADHGIPIYGRRGCSTHVRETCFALTGAGHEITLLCSKLGRDEEVARELDIIEVKPPTSRKIGYDLRNLWHNRAFHRAARQLMEERKFDAIYERFSLYSLAGTWLGKRYDKPRIVELNAFLSVEHVKKIHFLRLARKAEKHIAVNAPALAVVSQPLHDSLVEMGVDSKRIFTMPMAVDITHFRPETERGKRIRNLWNLDGRYVIGYVGGLAEWHGISMLRQLAKNIKKQRGDFTIFVVGGEKIEADKHRRQARDEGLEKHLVFTGSVPYNHVPAYINAMDVALVPDTNYWTCPTKMFEYQASGIPTVAPKYSAILSAMDHGKEGLLFEPKNMVQAAQCILELGDKPEERKTIGQNAQRRVAETHSWQHNVTHISRLFEDMCSGAFPKSGPLPERVEPF